MKIRPCILNAIIAILFLLTGCAIPVATEEMAIEPTSVPTESTPILAVIDETSCRYGPGDNYDQAALLEPGLTFAIIAIDDDIAWIDDDIAWFQVDPTAIIDPEPPDHPLSESDGSEIVLHCWVPGDAVDTSGDLSLLPVIRMPVLEVISAAGCHAGPGDFYELINELDVGHFFRILAVDNDITWIDDDIAWFQVDPTALVDPNPPHRPLNELSPQPDPPGSTLSLRCWVPGDAVETSGDLSMLPSPFPHPGVRTLADANCRSGPTMDFPLLSILPAGGEFEIRATNTSGDAWMVFDPGIDNTCWVYGDLVEVLGDASGVMIIDPDPPGTPVPVVCSNYGMDRGSCERDPSCWWNPTGGVGNGGCANK